MKDVFYFGARLENSLSQAFFNAGYGMVRMRYTKGVLVDSSNCVAVVLHWKSTKGQQIIEEAKAEGLPIVVITSKLAHAVQAGKPYADLYLEEPARDAEVVAMLLDMITATLTVPMTAAKTPVLVMAASNGGGY